MCLLTEKIREGEKSRDGGIARISRDLEISRCVRYAKRRTPKRNFLLAIRRADANADGEGGAEEGGYLLRNQMRLYEIYDGENCCLEETDGRTRKM